VTGISSRHILNFPTARHPTSSSKRVSSSY
jgi:hypothetical protein